MGVWRERIERAPEGSIWVIVPPAAPLELAQWRPPASQLDANRVAADAPSDAGTFDGRDIAILNGTSRTARQLPYDGRTDKTYFLDTTDPGNIWTPPGSVDTRG